MKSFLEKRRAQTLALALLCLFTLLAAAASVIVNCARSEGWYYLSEHDGFEATSSCRDYVAQANYYVASNVQWLEDLTLDTLGSYAGEAFSYVIQSDGVVTADTTTDRSVSVDTCIAYLEDGTAFSVTGYVNLPVEPYDGCYSEYAAYRAFFGLRYAAAVCKAAFLALAALAALTLCFGAAKRGREGRLAPILCKPFDAVLAADALALLLLYRSAEAMVNGLWRLVRSYIGIYPTIWIWPAMVGLKVVFTVAAAAFALWYMAGQLGAGSLHRGLLLSRLPPIVSVLMLLGVHVFLLYAEEILARSGYPWLLGKGKLLLVAIDAAAAPVLAVYARQARRVRRAARELAAGNLSYKTDTDRLRFVWRELGEDLNRIGDGMAQAVEDRLKSERMKTELITNVSHDLKTPLTSIINYIDLLKSGGLDEETRKEYLAVLDRQSAKLKKLTEDVVEASKAASGAITVNREPIDAVELLEQLLGEYSGRMEAAEVTPVLTAPEERVTITADSALLGRVIENLITNIIKYAQPGTRAYFDLTRSGETATITAKNVSREPLNISAEELMERFVRGDSSRHSEGSGLGLSIARSLTELMGGRLRLTLDGDLFKAALSLPTAGLPEQTERLPEAAESPAAT